MEERVRLILRLALIRPDLIFIFITRSRPTPAPRLRLPTE